MLDYPIKLFEPGQNSGIVTNRSRTGSLHGKRMKTAGRSRQGTGQRREGAGKSRQEAWRNLEKILATKNRLTGVKVTIADATGLQVDQEWVKGKLSHSGQNISEKAIRNVIRKTKSKATMKILSAISSNNLMNLSCDPRIDKNENKLHVINIIQAIPVSSSIFVTSSYFEILSEVNTIRQNPKRLEEVFKICCGFLFGMFF